MKKSSYNLLIEKLDAFIRKYYFNKIIKGCLIFTTIALAGFLLFSVFEHHFYFSKPIRKVLFFSFIVLFFSGFVSLVFLPILNYFKLGKIISHEQAAKIIGDHFGDVKDKLLNILQLRKKNDNGEFNQLIEASINQKSNQISLVPFKSAINISDNKKYLRYAMPPLFIVGILLMSSPKILTDSTYRIINNDTEFEKPAPFHFEILTKDLNVIQYSDIDIEVTTKGEIVPDQVLINESNYSYKMKKLDNNRFKYTFFNVQKPLEFSFASGKINSKPYKLKLILKPSINNFDVQITYPNYLNRKSETISNVGDISVPQGSVLKWNLETKNTDKVLFRFKNSVENSEKKTSTTFIKKKQLFSSSPYTIFYKNDNLKSNDSINYYINIVEDKYPSINAELFKDSSEHLVHFFAGNASDDHGIKKVNFTYQILNAQGAALRQNTSTILKGSNQSENFEHIFDLNELNINPGEEVQMYFEAFDNDGVNGSKSTKSQIITYKKQTKEEFKEEEQNNEEEITDNLEDSFSESKKLNELLEKLRNELLQKQDLSWQDKKKMEEIMKNQEEISKKLDQAKELNKKNLEKQSEYLKLPENIKKQQERVQELFNENQSEEIDELMKKIQDLMNELNKDQALEFIDQMQMNQKNIEQKTERLKELYKQLEVEKEINESIEELEKLSDELDKLSNKTEENKENKENNSDLLNKHQDINKKFDDLKDKINDLKKKNDELEYPKNMKDDIPEQMEQIDKELDSSKEQLQSQQNQNSAQKQQSASQKMKKLAKSLQSEMSAGQQKQLQEDIKMLRQLLENLITLSFDQEEIIDHLGTTTINTARYTDLSQEQLKIGGDFKIIEDTLLALSKRHAEFETFITEKVNEINLNLDNSLDKLENRDKANAETNQRFSMKNMNDLALLLSESLANMQKQMASMMSGKQMCLKPGNSSGKNGTVPMDKITKGQKELSDELKKMQSGKKGKNGKPSPSAEEFAKAAAQQAALRRVLEELKKQKEELGQGQSGELQDILDKMNQQEVDLVNKKLDNDMMKRQQDIFTKLLEAEKAEREQEYDNERKSKEGKSMAKNKPPSLEKYLKERNSNIESYKNSNPELGSYYRILVDQYYRKLMAK